MSDIRCKLATTPRELRAHFGIRRRVFVEEQGVFEESDLDEHDRHALFLVAWDLSGMTIAGAVRCYRKHRDTWFGGRLGVLDEYRGRTVGADLVRKAEEVVRDRGCRRFLAWIQVANVPFFKYLGWEPIGETEQHHGLEHQQMITEWSQPEEPLQREQSA